MRRVKQAQKVLAHLDFSYEQEQVLLVMALPDPADDHPP